MGIVKTFTNIDAIIHALDTMMEYPFGERPILEIKYIGMDDEEGISRVKWIEGTLDHTRDGLVFIRMPGNFENDYIFLNSIMELYVHDFKVY